MATLRKATKGRTSISIAHRLSTVMDADEILVIENGTLLERGSHSELLTKRNSLYSKMWDIQHSVGDVLKSTSKVPLNETSTGKTREL